MKKMRIKDLKELIKDLPDNMLVVSTGMDHSYERATAGVVETYTDGCSMSEYYEGFENDEPDEDFHVVEVFWVD